MYKRCYLNYNFLKCNKNYCTYLFSYIFNIIINNIEIRQK